MELALRGLQVLSEWTSIVTELFSVHYNYFFYFFKHHILNNIIRTKTALPKQKNTNAYVI